MGELRSFLRFSNWFHNAHVLFEIKENVERNIQVKRATRRRILVFGDAFEIQAVVGHWKSSFAMEIEWIPLEQS